MHKINAEVFKKKTMLRTIDNNFQHDMFGKLTVIANDNNELYFVGKEVAEILGYVNVSQTISDHCKGYIKTILPTNGGNQEVVVIPERDLYRLIMRSKKPEAEKFEEWVVGDVLPTIRKYGVYATENTIEKILNDPDFAIQTLTKLKEERAMRVEAESKAKLLSEENSKQEALLLEQAPKVEFFDAVTGSEDLIDLGSASKVLNLGYGRNTLFEKLRNLNILMPKNQPYQIMCQKDYFRVIETSYTKGNGDTHIYLKTMVTQKGLDFIRKKLAE